MEAHISHQLICEVTSHSCMLDTFPFNQFVSHPLPFTESPRKDTPHCRMVRASPNPLHHPWCPVNKQMLYHTANSQHGAKGQQRWQLKTETQSKTAMHFLKTNSVARADILLQFINLYYDFWDHPTNWKWKIATIFLTKETAPANNVTLILRKVEGFEGEVVEGDQIVLSINTKNAIIII